MYLEYQIWDLRFPIGWDVGCYLLTLAKLLLQLFHLQPSPSRISNINVFLGSSLHNYCVYLFTYNQLISAREREELIVLSLMVGLDFSVVVLYNLFLQLNRCRMFQMLSFPSQFYKEMVLLRYSVDVFVERF